MTPISTWRIRVDTPSGRKSYMVEARSAEAARQDIEDFLRLCGVTGEIVDVGKAGDP